jgi:TatA/E family protein of Tat protein translocase
MGFLGIGAMEAVVILVIALIIFGPGRLPEIMSEAGRTLRDFRRATRELTGDFQDSITEVRQTYDDLEKDMRQTARDLKRDTESIAKDVNTAVEGATKLDSTPRSSTSRARSETKPDQQPAEAGGATPGHAPARAGAAKPAAPTATVAVSSKNGAQEPVDDLLASEDGDDLLSVERS